MSLKLLDYIGTIIYYYLLVIVSSYLVDFRIEQTTNRVREY